MNSPSESQAGKGRSAGGQEVGENAPGERPAQTLITDPAAAARFCRGLAGEPYITVDTEFLRDRTYWPRLCLLQVAGSAGAAAIDALAPGMDLGPVFALMADENVLKVFHSARQDVEIFFHLSGAVPKPIFDTQVAAMVCGYGESVSYETLVSRLAHARLDKSSRFTDWSHRPLSARQIDYALDDVIHLRTVYEALGAKLEHNRRAPWMAEEMSILTDPATYRIDPQNAWRRLKSRSQDRRFLAIVRALAAWRETEAQRRDLPRNWVLRDEALLELAALAPGGPEDFKRARRLPKDILEGRNGALMLEIVASAKAIPPDLWPEPETLLDIPAGQRPVLELLKVLLKVKSDRHHVAQRLIATAPDLEAITLDDAAAVPALHGWRREIFGEDALALKHGRLAIAVNSRGLQLVPLDGEAADEPAPGSEKRRRPRRRG